MFHFDTDRSFCQRRVTKKLATICVTFYNTVSLHVFLFFLLDLAADYTYVGSGFCEHINGTYTSLNGPINVGDINSDIPTSDIQYNACSSLCLESDFCNGFTLREYEGEYRCRLIEHMELGGIVSSTGNPENVSCFKMNNEGN